MNKINSILVIILLAIIAGCGGNKQSTDDFITVDVTANYPKKELILQDFMDVEYIALETSDDFVTQGEVRDVGKNILIITNLNFDGDIFIFDRRTGKGIRKINRYGQGGEEYTFILGITLDEDNNEMFINDRIGRIQVYDLFGKFKRSLRHKKGVVYTSKIFNYDKDNLLCQESIFQEADIGNRSNTFFIVSKQDGSVKDVLIPFKKKLSTSLMTQYFILPMLKNLATPFQNNWLLTEPSSDTVYRYRPDDTMTPFIVRTPSIQSMDPKVFLFPAFLTNRYYFMETVTKEFVKGTFDEFPRKGIMYDTQEKTIFECTVYNGDYTNKTFVKLYWNFVNAKIAF